MFRDVMHWKASSMKVIITARSKQMMDTKMCDDDFQHDQRWGINNHKTSYLSI